MTPFSAKLFLSICFIALLSPTMAQVTFDKGYIIDKEGKKIECLIENKDRLRTPLNFRYKLSENETPRLASVQDVKEVGIYNYGRYVSASVQVDTSSSIINHYSASKAPEWSRKTIFLKVLVKGNATLYNYESLELIRFFFETKANPSIRQLVFKEYIISDLSFGENVTFRQQLFTDVNCGNMSKVHFEQMNYRLDELKKHFIKYNSCMGGGEVAETELQRTPAVKRNMLNFSITPGFNYSSLSMNSPGYPVYDVAFGGDLRFRLGLQMEYVFPFNRNKWSVFIEPTYQTYHTSSEYYHDRTFNNIRSISVDYSSIEVPVGFRYYSFLRSGSKFFLNMFFVPNPSPFSNSTIVYSITSRNVVPPGFTTSTDVTINLAPALTIGVGIGYGGRVFSIEARYYGTTNLAPNDVNFIANYKRSALIVAYRFLSIKK